MCAADTDTYKCCAANEFGKAVCTATLSVTDGKSWISVFTVHVMESLLLMSVLIAEYKITSCLIYSWYKLYNIQKSLLHFFRFYKSIRFQKIAEEKVRKTDIKIISN